MSNNPEIKYIGQSTEISLGCEGICPNRRTLKFPLGAHALLSVNADGINMSVSEGTTFEVAGITNTIVNQSRIRANTCENPCERSNRIEEVETAFVTVANSNVKLR